MLNNQNTPVKKKGEVSIPDADFDDYLDDDDINDLLDNLPIDRD